MKRFFYLAVICCVVMLTFSACEKDKEIGTTANLFGRWEAMIYSQEYMVFSSDVAEDGWYWGYEWNADDKPESDLLPGGRDYHGNGWFMWKKGKNYITMRNMMNGSPAEVAIDRKLTALDDKNMTLVNTRGQSKQYVKKTEKK